MDIRIGWGEASYNCDIPQQYGHERELVIRIWRGSPTFRAGMGIWLEDFGKQHCKQLFHTHDMFGFGAIIRFVKRTVRFIRFRHTTG